jgi:putative Mg2+ transporter-C (MgtC) family protein
MIMEFTWEIALRLLLSALLGGLIGLEREVHGRPAGFRTHLLVTLGSALFVLTSIHFYRTFGNFSGQFPVGTDPARIAAQVVTGIGFLGAGAIIREKASIRGLTTAACLWVAAAVGVAVGVGMYLTGIMVTILSVGSLVFLKKLENRLKKDSYFSVRVWSTDRSGLNQQIEALFEKCRMQIVHTAIERNFMEKTILFEFEVKAISRDECGILSDRLANLEGVRKIRLE